jgi:hypothetical protein
MLPKNWMAYADLEEYIPFAENLHEIPSSWVDRVTALTLCYSSINWFTSSVHAIRCRPLVHLRSSSATEMLFLHASLYILGASSFGNWP